MELHLGGHLCLRIWATPGFLLGVEYGQNGSWWFHLGPLCIQVGPVVLGHV